jgi:hypothetical protein
LIQLTGIGCAIGIGLTAGAIVLAAPLLAARAIHDDPPPRAASHQLAADYSTPKKTLETFLRAVKANYLAGAKECWFISDGNASGVLDILVGN